MEVSAMGWRRGVLTVVSTLACAATVAAQTTATSWNPPRRADGQPDIEGIWAGRGGTTTYSIEAGDDDRRVHLRITGQVTDAKGLIVDPPDGKIPYQPWAAARRNDIYEKHTDPPSIEYIDPIARGCFPSGVPRINYQGGNTIRIIQPPGYVVMVHEFQHLYRVIPLDDRPRLSDDVKLWMGESRGRWEGNTLVVDVRNLNDRTWFDIVGGIHTDALRVVERWTFADPQTLGYEATMEDPKAFTRPWTVRILGYTRAPAGYEQWEDACVEGNRAVELMLRK
jgi:hypothetical protein